MQRTTRHCAGRQADARHGSVFGARSLLLGLGGTLALTAAAAAPAEETPAAAAPDAQGVPAVSAPPALAREVRTFEVAPQPLAAALAAFAEQAGLELAGLERLPAALESGGITGTYTVEDALGELLRGTGIGYRFDADGGVQLVMRRRAVEEIVVTARKRNELIQDVPISVTAFDAGALKAARATRLADVINLTPNAFAFPEADGQTTISIRGVRSTTFARETGVPVYLDGAYSSIQTAAPDLDFFDLCSVQVLRGPQGGLYGRNAVGGAMLLDTCDPTDELETELSFEAGSFDTRRFDGVLNVPLLSEKIALRASGYFRETEGAFRNLFTGDKIDESDAWGWRGVLRFNPLDDVEVKLLVEQTDEDLSQSIWSLDGNSHQRETDVNTPGFTERDRERYNLNLTWETDRGTLESITSYIRLDNFGLADTDRRSDLGRFFEAGAHSTLFTHETRFASASDGPWSWLIGLQFYRERFRSRDATIHTDQVEATFFTDNELVIDSDRVTENTALFAETSYRFFDRLELAVTLRATYESRAAKSFTTDSVLCGHFLAGVLCASERDLLPQFLTPNQSVNPRLDRLDDGERFFRIDPGVSVSYEWTPDIMTYAKFNTAYKSGSSNFFSPNVVNFLNPMDEIFGSLFFDKEEAEGYEIGMKASLFEQRYVLNLATFYLEQEQLQLLVETQTIATVDNAGDAETWGAEIELVARPLDEHDLQLMFSYSYIDAEFVDFTNAPNPDASGFATEDRSGNQIPFRAKDLANFSADYVYQLNESYALRWHSDFTWTHGGFYNSRNTEPLDDQRNWNLKLTLESERFDFGFYVENVFDSTYWSRPVTDVNDDTPNEIFAGRLNRPREYGVTATVRF